MGNLCMPSCVKNNQGTIISIRSACFSRPIKIIIDDEDDDMLEHLDGILTEIKRKKTMIRENKSNLSEIDV